MTSGALLQADGTTCSGLLCNASAGYDGPTGMGSPDGLDMAGINRELLTLNYGTIDQSDPYLGDPGTRTITLSPSGVTPSMLVSTGNTWSAGCPFALSFAGLPQGVTSAIDFAVNGTEPSRIYHLVAAANATVGQQTTMTITATACGVSHSVQAEIIVLPPPVVTPPTCTPKVTCSAAEKCGTIVNDCNQTVSCGSCGTAHTCTNHVCVASCKTPKECCTQGGGDFINNICQ